MFQADRGTTGEGVVIAVQANYYWVRLAEGSSASAQGEAVMLLCTRRARLKKIGQQVWVGDRVAVEDIDWGSERGAIAQVMPRHTTLERPPVANAQLLLLVFALAEPELDPWQLSRFLVAAESTGLAVALGLNKCDRISPEAQQQWRDRLIGWGYDPIIMSVQQGIGLDAVRQQLSGRISVVSGPSGVGKSSLINHLIPAVNQRVNAVSGKLARGRHTTRHVELFELSSESAAEFSTGFSAEFAGGGLLADSPGFNQPTITCAPEELGNYFPEVRQRLSQDACQFGNCLHRDEPGCVVRGGRKWERYDHYLTFLAEAIARQTALGQTAAAEESVKRLSGEAGQVYYEPKLKTKRYRRPSRRSRHQNLKTLCGDIDELLDTAAEEEPDLESN
ncbi:MAG: small ribosomal subunit biogenesis GTPase RsgA [Elainellaceae cyanobacterium]